MKKLHFADIAWVQNKEINSELHKMHLPQNDVNRLKEKKTHCISYIEKAIFQASSRRSKKSETLRDRTIKIISANLRLFSFVKEQQRLSIITIINIPFFYVAFFIIFSIILSVKFVITHYAANSRHGRVKTAEWELIIKDSFGFQ